MGGGGAHSQGASSQGRGLPLGVGGMLPPRGPPPGGTSSQGGPGGDIPPRTATAVGGMHHTGMHSCLMNYQILDLLAVSLWYLTFYFLSRGLNNIEPTHLLK